MPACPLSPAEFAAAESVLRAGIPAAVRTLQQTVLGFTGPDADGLVGPKTRAALEKLRPSASAETPGAPAFDAALVERVLVAAGALPAQARRHAARAAAAMERYAIDTPLRAGHFLAQIVVETGGLRYLEEIWGPTAAQRGYEGRADLGNTHRGDGYRYRGRGVIQLTGRANYRRLAEHLQGDGVASWDVVANPEFVGGEHAWRAAGYWWASNDANRWADAGDDELDVRRVSRLVNRGSALAHGHANHEEQRVEAFRAVAKALRAAGAWA